MLEAVASHQREEPMEVFACQRCGSCCHGQGGIVISEGEQRRLAAHLGLSQEEFCSRYTQRRGKKWLLTVRQDGWCVFFEEGLGCRVHAAKPDVCRAWPFFRGNIEDPVSWQMAATACPGICLQAGHECFAAAGRSYLHAHNLQKHGHPDEATALTLPAEIPLP